MINQSSWLCVLPLWDSLRGLPRRVIFFAFLVWAWLLPQVSVSAEIEVNLSRNPVPLGESFTLSFSSESEPSGDPDFSPLSAQFEILNQRRSSQFSLENGRMHRSHVYEVEVIAKSAGKIDIPPIPFGADRSKPFSVMITHGAVAQKRPGEADLFLEVEATPKNPYISQEVQLSVRVLSRVAFSGDLAQPELEGLNLSKLNADRQFSAMRGGAQYRVNERRYVFFPNQSGKLVIPPVNLTAELGNTPGLGPFAARPRQQRFHSEPLTLEIRPIPPAFKGKVWLPLKKLELKEEWAPKNFEVQRGDPLTRNLMVQAEGANQGMIPDILGEAAAILGVQQYGDQAELTESLTGEGMVSQRKEKRAYIASGTDYAVPEVAVPWWNTQTDRMEVALLPGRAIKVLPGANALPAPGFAQPPEPLESMPQPAPRTSPVQTEADSQGGMGALIVWQGAALLFFILWLSTLVLWTRLRQTLKRLSKRDGEFSAHGPLDQKAQGDLRSLELALEQNEWQRAHQILQAWGRGLWAEEGPESLERRLESALGVPYQELKRCLYSPKGGGISDAAGLLKSFKATQRSTTRRPVSPRTSKEDPSLEPLYRS